MEIKCYGVRGSHPVSSQTYLKYGGNTTSITIKFSDDITICCDAGSGIINYGNECISQGINDHHIFLTHFHADHIQGFPFFKPIFLPTSSIHLYSAFPKGWETFLSQQMNAINFPVKFKDLLSSIKVYNGLDHQHFAKQGITIDYFSTEHPSTTFAYKFSHKNKSVIFCPDNELGQFSTEKYDQFKRFCSHASLLIHDAQYTEDELHSKKGWGHSTIKETLNLATSSRVDQCLLFHHDPERTDSQIDILTDKLLSKFPHVNFAIEGSTIKL